MDDLLDLNWSAPQKGQTPPSMSSSSTGSSNLSKPPGGSSFDLFAKPSSGSNYYSTSSSRASTPLAPSPRPPVSSALGAATARPSSGLARPGSAATPPPQAAAAAGDAFSDLFGAASGGAAGAGKNLTMAEKQAQMAKEKKDKEEREREQWSGGGFWDKFEGSSGGSAMQPAAPVPAPAASSGGADSFSGLLAPTAAAAKPKAASVLPTPPTSRPASTAQKKSAGTFWDDHDDLLAPSKSSATPKAATPAPAITAAAPADPWDLDALSAAVPSASNDDGGFGSFGDDDDLLGELGRPARKASPKTPAPQRSTAHDPRARASSPPPHIVGQIVEMGFSPAQARAALARTATGEDVAAALESLLGGSRGATPPVASGGRGRAASDVSEQSDIDDERIAREMQDREMREYQERQERQERQARRRAGPSRDAVRPRDAEQQRQDGEQGQVDDYIAQASEIGASVLSKATSFWNTGKEKAFKVYEEQRKALEAQQAAARRGKGPAPDGRPRWMIEAEEAEAGGSERRSNGHDAVPAGGDFRDGFDDDPTPVRPQPQQRQQQQRKPEPTLVRTAMSAQGGDLLFGDEPKKYVSPHHQAKGRGTPTPVGSGAATPRAPAARLVQRDIVSASASQLSTAAALKAKGNEHFKLGRFTEAETDYSAAIRALPEGHLQLVPLLNNRAATWLKLGESSSAAKDCTAVVELVGASYHPSKEAPLPADVDVKLGEGLVKATAKRAQAWEMAEKWNQALADWEKVLGYDGALGGAATKGQASEGIRRAKAMLSGGGDGNSAGAAAPRPARATPKPKPRPSKPVDVHSSAAVSELRKAAAAAATEDEQRMALKDSIDAKLTTWRTGKETNVRALIASLDTVLWDAVLVKVGMHELVTEKQVKIKYMKVIARLHPDKLKGASVEERMVANGVFGTLSEAWAAHNA